MTALWTIADILAATGGRSFNELPETVDGLSIDTRTLKPGDAFFAIAGDRFDGHDFASRAVAAGASVLVISEAKLPALGRLRVGMIVVPDVLRALNDLAVAARARSKAKIIAVTGSVGKTTTKEMLRHVLEAQGRVHASPKSFNNHWGVPLTLARLPEDADYGVFEIGMNHPNEIRPLVKLVQPQVSIITCIAAAHLGQFRDLDEIAHAKAEIFEGLAHDGVALLNRDDDKFALLSGIAKRAGVKSIAAFGHDIEAHYRLIDIEGPRGEHTMWLRDNELTFSLPLPGAHMVQNALCVLGAVDLIGADPVLAAEKLTGLTAVEGRGKRHHLRYDRGHFTLIDESYNANPTSVAAAVAVLGAEDVGPGGRRIAVLGDMLELGEHAPSLHAGLAKALTAARIDRVFLVGSEMEALKKALPVEIAGEHRQTVEEMLPLLFDKIHAGDVLMVKASFGVGFGKIIDKLIDEFPAVGVDGADR